MIITSKIVDGIMGFNAIWVTLHLIYFSSYYSRYSACFHKLSSIDGLEKSGLYEQELIDVTRENTWKKIKKLQLISFFPTLGITLLHLAVFYFYWQWEVFVAYFASAIYILIGALVFIFLANKTQGSRVLRGKSPRWPGGPF